MGRPIGPRASWRPHKTRRVDEFLIAHLDDHLHFTPTYSSWLNQVEMWFGKIEGDVIGRGVFTFLADLKRKLMRHIRQYNKKARPVKWKYFRPGLPDYSQSIVIFHSGMPLRHLRGAT